MIRLVIALLIAGAVPTEWERYESESCGFALDFPGTVEVRTEPISNGTMTTFSTLRGRDSFSIACAELPAALANAPDREERLDIAARDAVQGASVERVTADGYSARRTRRVYDLGDAELVVQHLHLFTATHKLSLGLADFDATDEEVERFFGSLDVLDGASE